MSWQSGQESGATQRHKFLGEAAEAAEIRYSPLILKDSDALCNYHNGQSRLNMSFPLIFICSHPRSNRVISHHRGNCS